MKYTKLMTAAMIAFMTVSCSKELIETTAPETTPEVKVEREYIEVSMGEADTKVQPGQPQGNKIPVLWSEKDQITVKDGEKSAVYELVEGQGTQNGKFRYVSGANDIAVISDIIYPAGSDGTIPAEQNYVAGSPDPKAIVMTYKKEGTEEGPLVLKHQSSVLHLEFKAEDALSMKSIDVKFFRAKKVAADKWDEEEIIFTLNVPEKALNATPTAFDIAVPAYAEARSVTVTARTAEGRTLSNQMDKKFTAGQVHAFPVLTFLKSTTFQTIDRTDWKIIYCNDQAADAWTAGHRYGSAKWMLDGDFYTFWNYKKAGNAEHFNVIIDMGREINVEEIVIVGRPDTGANMDKVRNPVREMELAFATSVSATPEKDTWTFTNYKELPGWPKHYDTNFNSPVTLENPVTARYIYYRFIDGWHKSNDPSKHFYGAFCSEFIVKGTYAN